MSIKKWEILFTAIQFTISVAFLAAYILVTHPFLEWVLLVQLLVSYLVYKVKEKVISSLKEKEYINKRGINGSLRLGNLPMAEGNQPLLQSMDSQRHVRGFDIN